MLTGPVTMLQWSFVRDDQPRSSTCLHWRLPSATKSSTWNLPASTIIQIDEPGSSRRASASRRGPPELPVVGSGRISIGVAGVADGTQIHTHMCYANFDDIIASIAAFDADVISIEAARSGMELLDSFAETGYPNDIGPGIWDIHSPRVPTADEMAALLSRAVSVFGSDRLWINPDCGLKTRSWSEVEPSLRNLVEAARRIRAVVKTPE